MDPLTLTLAAIALATAVKDITELGLRIQGSFSKVSAHVVLSLCKAHGLTIGLGVGKSS